MTSQTLLSKGMSEGSTADVTRSSNASGSGVCLLEKPKTLYHGDQQAELQHLQAETEALLRQLQALKQQRTASAHALSEI